MPKRSPIRYLVLLILLVILLVLQSKLWFGNGGLRDGMMLERQVTELRAENKALQQRNRTKASDVRELKNGTDEIEEIARKDLGMIKRDEVFYQILGDKPTPRDRESVE